MADIFEVLLDKQPSWFFQLSSIILTIILGICAVWVFKGAKRYYQAVDKENRIVTLLEEKNTLYKDNNENKAITDQMCVVLENSTTFIKALNDSNNNDVATQIQTIIESLATDIKNVVGERHRCGYWVADENGQYLSLVNGSAAFPHGYVNSRTLDINHSIAGRCYRKNETLFINDVVNDADWVFSDSPSSYTSLICVPVAHWGVITIDGKQKMTHNTVLISKLYASIIEGFMNKLLLNLSHSQNDSQNEAAAGYANDADEGGGNDEHE
ncbi:GAF domain-containing protein [Neobacillus mesonae]|uniref:GAF domain-containing protein n=1 Tax=Neobacillus mesonae TaxID=1193713 RepID=UPI002E1FB57E|nr:GAF domain-containing protein [Neobacillus mesonae]